MAIAIAVTLWQKGLVQEGYEWIAAGAAIGAVVGVVGARRVKMTAMPQMVALFNGVGGGAAALIAFSEFHIATSGNGVMPNNELWSTLFSAIVGSISFAGSMVAFGKLQEVITGSPVTLPAQKLVNAVMFAAILALAVWQYVGTQR